MVEQFKLDFNLKLKLLKISMCIMRVSMGLTDRRKTTNNLVDSRKN